MRAVFIAAIIGSVAGCSSSPNASDGGDGLDLCAYLSGRTFVSQGQSVCGVGPDGGTYSCNQFVFFNANGTFTWTHEDTGDYGTYSCLGLMITVVSNNIGTFTATYDPGTGILDWYTGAYQLQ